MNKSTPPLPSDEVDVERRKFLAATTTIFGLAGVACMAVPFLKSILPEGNAAKAAPVDVRLTDIPEGTYRTYVWQGKPVFVWHRNPAQIAEARHGDHTTMVPEPDAERIQNPAWLVVTGICTHLGCVPMAGGESQGWVCPCHGSQFDLSGRVTKGPANRNLDIPPYRFIDENTIRIG